MKNILEELRASNNYRQLNNVCQRQKYIIYNNKQYLNLSSNDYLSLSDTSLQQEFFDILDVKKEFIMSNPSSRLMTGNSEHYNELELSVANLYRRETSLVLGSGFLLNSGVLPAITTSKDLVIADKLVHASIIDGIRLCDCHWERFRHNDMDHLESILMKKREQYDNVYIVSESIFSMDGDIAPINKMIELKFKYGAVLYIDEAHAFGVRGDNGGGISDELGVTGEVDIIVGTFGKAICSQGAYIVCDNAIRELLINKMRTLIFSTALPPISLMWSKFIVDSLSSDYIVRKRKSLNNNAVLLSDSIYGTENRHHSHIIPFIVGDNHKVLLMSQQLKEAGYWVTAIRYPTVAKDSARLRISLSSAITEDEIHGFADSIKTCYI